MRVLILTPTALPEISGNAMTAERWRRGLREAGWEVLVQQTRGLPGSRLANVLSVFRPDLIHVHHAYFGGRGLFDPEVRRHGEEIPLVLSPGGTDFNEDLKVADRRETIAAVLRKARRIIVQNGAFRQQVEEAFPEYARLIAFVPKTVCWMGEDVFDLRAAAGCFSEEILFFFPAGIRPVKGQVECLRGLEKVFRTRPEARTVFAGAALNREYAGIFFREVGVRQGFARWIPPVQPQAMRSAYGGADVVLNASFSEGLSNVLLEAAAAGKPVLASRIPGNIEPVLGSPGDAPAGLLYDAADSNDFLEKALALIDDRTLRARLGAAGKSRVFAGIGPAREARRLIEVYEEALGR